VEAATLSALRPRILVVDDDPQIHRFLGPALDAAGYESIRADTGADGLAAIALRPPDGVILDLSLPDIDGKDVIGQARDFYDGPILILSARDVEMEKIRALDLGADDYVGKPFHVGELLARLRVATRHRLKRAGSPAIVRAGDIQIDLLKRLVTRCGSPVRLSPLEYDILARLVVGGGKVLTHRQLLTAVWGPASADKVQYLRVFIGHLRRKLEATPSLPRHLVTEGGVGYRFVAG
jgi:two-component system KDP operon response regulator KdpE